MWHACEKPLKTQICGWKSRTSYLSVSLTRRAADAFVPVLRECMTWTNTDWSFSCLKDMGWWSSGVCCDLSRLSPRLFHVLTMQTWLLLQWVSVCPAGHPPVSNFPLENPCLAHTSPMTFMMSLTSFLPSAFQTQFIQVGSVYLGNINEKLELLSDVGLMMVQVTIFFPFEKMSWSSLLLFATLLLWHVKGSMLEDQTSSGFHVITCGVCLWTFLKSPGLFLD